MTIYANRYSRLLQNFIFPTNLKKLDEKALKALDDAKNDEEVLEKLEKLMETSKELFSESQFPKFQKIFNCKKLSEKSFFK